MIDQDMVLWSVFLYVGRDLPPRASSGPVQTMGPATPKRRLGRGKRSAGNTTGAWRILKQLIFLSVFALALGYWMVMYEKTSMNINPDLVMHIKSLYFYLYVTMYKPTLEGSFVECWVVENCRFEFDSLKRFFGFFLFNDSRDGMRYLEVQVSPFMGASNLRFGLAFTGFYMLQSIALTFTAAMLDYIFFQFYGASLFWEEREEIYHAEALLAHYRETRSRIAGSSRDDGSPTSSTSGSKGSKDRDVDNDNMEDNDDDDSSPDELLTWASQNVVQYKGGRVIVEKGTAKKTTYS